MTDSSSDKDKYMHGLTDSTDSDAHDSSSDKDENMDDSSDSIDENMDDSLIHYVAQKNASYTPDRRAEKRTGAERRRHERSGFTYPVELKIFSEQVDHISFNGYLADISVSGAHIQFEDKYGRINVKDQTNSKVKVAFHLPTGENIALISKIMWIRHDPSQSFLISAGVQFQEVEDWHLDAIKQLINLKNKDKNMMWNLWENYEKQS